MRAIVSLLCLCAVLSATSALAGTAVTSTSCKAAAIKAALKFARHNSAVSAGADTNPSFVGIDQDDDDPSIFNVTVSQDEECLGTYKVVTKSKSGVSKTMKKVKCTVPAGSVTNTDLDCG